jgi:hypothetical protein
MLPQNISDIYWTLQPYIPEDNALNAHCCESIRSCISSLLKFRTLKEIDSGQRCILIYEFCVLVF